MAERTHGETGESSAKRLKVSHDNAEQQDDFFRLHNGERFDELERLYTISESVTLDEALTLHKYFSGPNNLKALIQSSKNPGLEIINFLRKRSIITTTNIDELEKASTELKLSNLSESIEESTKILTEKVASVKVRSSHPLQLLENTLSSFKRNKLLGRFFQQRYGVHYIGAREGCIELLLAVTSDNSLTELRNDIKSGELARKLKEFLVDEGDLNVSEDLKLTCEEGITISTKLQISQRGSSVYRDMLFKVGENLSRSNVDELVNLADFSAREKNELNEHEEKKPFYLFHLLEEKGKLGENDVLWLQSNLVKIQNRTAARIVSNYILGGDESKDFPNEPEPSSSDDSSECISFQNFLTKLGLQDKFPCKLTLKMFLKVKDVPKKQDYIESFWQKLTSLDYRAGFPDHSVSNRFSMRDFIFCVLHCSDDFVRQDILEKMSACQLAVPIVLRGIDNVSTTFLLWALRRITKKWKGPNDSLAVEQPIVSYPVFIVLVLRIGNVRVSKSQVLNTMLSNSQGNALHSYFLTEETDIVKPKFSDGSIECAWFLPMHGNDKEIFKEAMAFFNLRGDCNNYPSQRKFACKASNITIAFIATDKRDENVELIREIKANSRKFLFVAVKEDDSVNRKSQKVHHPIYIDSWLFVRVLQINVLSRKICDIIMNVCENEDQSSYKCLEALTEVPMETMQIDEHRNLCKRAQRLVFNLFESTNTDDILKLKKSCFPLQDVWKDLVNIEKECFDADNEKYQNFEHQREHVLSEKRSKRNLQLQTCLSETMKKYYDMVNAGKDNSSLLHYILGFLQDKIYHVVNLNTKGDLEKIIEFERKIRERQVTASDASDLESTSIARSEIEGRANLRHQDILTECSKLHKKCRAKNLGCEHFLRELGQLYEAFKEVKQPQTLKTMDSAEITLLPELAATLVYEMHSLEILDGDTGSVPLIWVTSVLDSLTRMLGDPKVLVLSVIGVQSSGKSTFLNSMFGVRFPVRAGRCTRGLFIRFLQMEEKLAQELGCEYLIVVDTEGIRSLDHDDRRFDNELVTLALSIASVTIFNIEGENIGPDMTGILQIAAHALMRMKEVDLECHCRIVQQRVSDLTAGDRNKANTNRIMETLDHATKIAAEEEGLEGRYQFFADVVDLQVDENLQYIPCLWTGGMSPPNHMYSETVSRVKTQLFKDMREKSIVSEFTLSAFTQRIMDVWKAVKEEDFVFNFKDSVRAVDFNKFCLEYNKWIAEMRSDMAELTNQLLERIGYEMPDEEYDTEEFEEHDNYFDIDIDIEELKQRLSNRVEKNRNKLNGSVEQYITNHVRSKTIQRYKKLYLDEINIVLKDVENHALAALTDEYELRKLKLTKNLEKFKAKWRRRLSFEAKNAAVIVKVDDDTTHVDYETLFESHWDKWKEIINKECAKTKTQMTRSSLKIICEKLLLRITRDMAVGSEVRTLMSLEGGIDKHEGLPQDCSKYIHTKFVKAWIRHRLLSVKQNNIDNSKQTEEELIDDERHEAADYVASIIESESKLMRKKQYEKPFNVNIYQLMIQNTLERLSEKHDNFKPPQALIAKSLLCIAGGSLDFLYNNELEYGNNFSALLEEVKQHTLNDFVAFSIGKDHSLRAAEFIYYYMKPPIMKKLKKEWNDKRYDTEDRIFNEGKEVPWDLLYVIAEKFSSSKFDLFENLFFIPSKSSYMRFVNESPDERLDQVIQDMTNTLVLELTQTVEKCDRETCTGTLKEWGSKLADYLDCGFITAVGELFEVNGIAAVSTQLKDILNNKLPDVLTTNIQLNYSYIFNMPRFFYSYEKFLCSEVCPMCNAPCDNTLRNHTNHFSHLHRPRGFKGATYSDTNKLVIEDCSSSLLSRSSKFMYGERTYLCRQYKDILPDWDIRPSSDDPGKVFWQWLFVMFNNYMALLYECNPADIPQSWHSITKEEALTSLEEDKDLKMIGRSVYSRGFDFY